MIVKEYIKAFEKLGFGMFVHFGVYSVIGRGEWHKCYVSSEEYYPYCKQFNPEKDWAKQLVSTAKKAATEKFT